LWSPAVEVNDPYRTAMALVTLGPQGEELVGQATWTVGVDRLRRAAASQAGLEASPIPVLYTAEMISEADGFTAFLTPSDREAMYNAVGRDQAITADTTGRQPDTIDALVYQRLVDNLGIEGNLLAVVRPAIGADGLDPCTPGDDLASFFAAGLALRGVDLGCEADQLREGWELVAATLEADVTQGTGLAGDATGLTRMLWEAVQVHWPDDAELRQRVVQLVQDEVDLLQAGAAGWDGLALESDLGVVARELGVAFPLSQGDVAYLQRVVDAGGQPLGMWLSGPELAQALAVARLADGPDSFSPGDLSLELDQLAAAAGLGLVWSDQTARLAEAVAAGIDSGAADEGEALATLAWSLVQGGDSACAAGTAIEVLQDAVARYQAGRGLPAVRSTLAQAVKVLETCGAPADLDATKSQLKAEAVAASSAGSADLTDRWETAAVYCALDPAQVEQYLVSLGSDGWRAQLGETVADAGGLVGRDGWIEIGATFEAVTLLTGTGQGCTAHGTLGPWQD
jgi:hypothetical protein